jgi:hypothetical protein
MPTLKVAHLNQQGQNMIIVPLDSSFAHKTDDDQHSAVNELQARANGAGLRGSVVAVWDAGGGRMSFIAPKPWHPFVSSLDLPTVYQNLNKQISW